MAEQSLKTRPSEIFTVQAVNATTIARGNFAAICTVKDATTAKRGRATPFTSAKNRVWAGAAQVKAIGDTSSTRDKNVADVRITAEGAVEYFLPVTGLANTIADQGQMVYQTDTFTFTLFPAALCYPYGPVVEFSATSGYAWVRLASVQDLAQYALHAERINLGFVLLAGSTATTRKIAITMPYHGQIEKVGGWQKVAANTSITALTVNLRINNGTSAIALSGGVITITSAAAAGTKLSATAITGSNVFHEGETVEVYITPGTVAPASGEIELYILTRARLGT